MLLPVKNIPSVVNIVLSATPGIIHVFSYEANTTPTKKERADKKLSHATFLPI